MRRSIYSDNNNNTYHHQNAYYTPKNETPCNEFKTKETKEKQNLKKTATNELIRLQLSTQIKFRCRRHTFHQVQIYQRNEKKEKKKPGDCVW